MAKKEDFKFYVGKDEDGRVFLYGPSLLKRNGEFVSQELRKTDERWEFIEHGEDFNTCCMLIPSTIFPELCWEDKTLTEIKLGKNTKEQALDLLRELKEGEFLKDKEIQEALLGLFEDVCGIKFSSYGE